MKRFLPIAVAAAVGGAAVSQTYIHLPASLSPATNELPEYNLRPFMQPNSRVQMFFDATEVGSSSFTATELSLRWDGPVPQVGASGPFTIQRLRIRIGGTAVAVPGAGFDANLTAPLAQVLDSSWTYSPDPGIAAVHPWGDPNDSLRFPFTTPAPVTIPPGGFLVVELLVDGNNISNFGFAHALLDGARATGGPVNGSAISFGLGCPAGPGAANATIGTTGQYAPGAAHYVTGQSLGANTLALVVVGTSNTLGSVGALPFAVAGSPCSIYTSFDFLLLAVTDGSGALTANGQAIGLAVPANPAFAAIDLFEQILSYAPGATSFDFAFSDARQVTLGSWSPAGRGTWTVSHGSSTSVPFADRVEAFGLAVRLRLQ
jgi:hypothetical protein